MKKRWTHWMPGGACGTRNTSWRRHSIPPNLILDPCEVWSAREADVAHVDVLMTSFQQTMKMNSHGVLLVLQDNDLWATYSALNTPLRSAAMRKTLRS